MKKILMGVLAGAMMMTACNEKDGGKYSFTWKTDVFKENSIVVDSIQIMDENDSLIQTIKEIGADSIYFEGSIEEPILATMKLFLKMNGVADESDMSIILEAGNMVVDNNTGGLKGTPLNDKNAAFETRLFEIYQNEDSLNAFVKQYVADNKDNVAGMAALCNGNVGMLISPTLQEELYGMFSDKIKERKPMQKIKKDIEEAKKSAEGQKFIDFEAEYEGKVQRLSDYVGKGKYVLVDFWASWCGPCRQEIPNIKAVYDKFKGDKFEVVGVATWDEPEATLEAIEEEGITYPQIINAQKAGSDAYGINGIPEIILFGPDGTILKRGLRGDQIEKTVKENLGN